MKSLIFEKMYEFSKKPYQKWIKKSVPWPVKINDLLRYPADSLGFHLGSFLHRNNFEMQEKLEDHDVFHVLTNIGVSVEEEIGMQFYLLGNGKRSLYLFMVVATGMLFYATKINAFRAYYRRGKNALHFHDLEFLRMLDQPLAKIQQTFLIR